MIFILCWTLAQNHVFAQQNLFSLHANNKAIEALQNKNTYKAYQKMLEAIDGEAFNPVLRLNLGIIFLVNKEYDKALQEFKLAEELAGDHARLKFQARFNQAVAWAEKGKIPEALATYQSALEIDPQSVEVKTNIELLWQKGGSGGAGGKSHQDQSEGKGQKKSDSQSEPKDQDKNKENSSHPNPSEDQKKKSEPQPFSSRDLSPETVGKILEELKSQEQRVRAEHYSKGQKERPRDKDW